MGSGRIQDVGRRSGRQQPDRGTRSGPGAEGQMPHYCAWTLCFSP